jgi:hypothetical protein
MTRVDPVADDEVMVFVKCKDKNFVKNTFAQRGAVKFFARRPQRKLSESAGT